MEIGSEVDDVLYHEGDHQTVIINVMISDDGDYDDDYDDYDDDW